MNTLPLRSSTSVRLHQALLVLLTVLSLLVSPLAPLAVPTTISYEATTFNLPDLTGFVRLSDLTARDEYGRCERQL